MSTKYVIFLALLFIPGATHAGRAIGNQCLEDEARVYERLESRPADEALIHHTMEAAIQACERAAAEADTPARTGDLLSRAYLLRGTRLVEKGGVDDLEMIELYEEAIDRVSGVCSDRCEALIRLFEELSNFYLRSHRYADGRELLENALSIRIQTYGEADYRVAMGYHLLGNYYSTLSAGPEEIEAWGKDAEKADALYRRAISLVLEDERTPKSEAVKIIAPYVGHLIRSKRTDEAAEYQAIVDTLEDDE